MAAPLGEVMTPIRARQRGQGSLARLVEQAFGGELLLQHLELAPQRALAGRLQLLDDQLVVAARLVQADPAVGQHLVAVLEPIVGPRWRWRKKARPDLCRIVLEREIDVPGRGPREIREFAFDPDAAESLLEQRFRLAVELADGDRWHAGSGGFAWPEFSMLASISEAAQLLPKNSSAYNGPFYPSHPGPHQESSHAH